MSSAEMNLTPLSSDQSPPKCPPVTGDGNRQSPPIRKTRGCTEAFNPSTLSRDKRGGNSKRRKVSALEGADIDRKAVSPPPSGVGVRLSTLLSTGRSHSLNREKHTNLLVGVKTYKDTMHGTLSLEPVIQRIIDTPQFQRLHNLKQLGTSDYVYRGCTHTRFEHSIGVAHLAEKLARRIGQEQPSLGITEEDIMCVKIAGLCHDLGHGPFSHVWDNVFVRRMGIKWKHEQGSVDMLRYMLSSNGIDLSSFRPPLGARDLRSIEEMILGTPEGERVGGGRGPEKGFLYDIVNNTRSGLDVDKLDYFQRDSRASVDKNNVDTDRFIELARVLPAKDEKGKVSHVICYPDKMWPEALRLFQTRNVSHE
ncbi:unnamed protein product [Discosporangium mesarthrocarpum]